MFTGYNYGSALQAYAVKNLVSRLGYEAELWKPGKSLVKGRDIRPDKLMVLAVRTLSHPSRLKKSLAAYSAVRKQYPPAAYRMFDEFAKDYLQPKTMSYRRMRTAAKDTLYKAFVCGSDQIWNSTTYYVDPFYYLRFAPKEKRIAFAPSFGRDFVPDYNKKKISKYIRAFHRLSVREDSGVSLIRTLTGKDALAVLDPTLVISASEWGCLLGIEAPAKKGAYILAYFLDEPSAKAVLFMKALKEHTGLEILALPYERQGDWFDAVATAGPREFVNYVRSAAFVCTDSFHGTVFSLNFGIPFYTFDREYGSAENQASRITSILRLTKQEFRLNPPPEAMHWLTAQKDFSHCHESLRAEQAKAITYLMASIESVEEV